MDTPSPGPDRVPQFGGKMTTEIKPGRHLFYRAKRVAKIFDVSPKTIYRKADEFGGEWVAGRLRFPKNRIDAMAERLGARVT